MRIYIPITEAELNNREIETDFGFMDNQDLRKACPVDDWGAEEYEDLAMTQASMYCLLHNEFIKYGRIVAAVEVKTVGAELEYPGAVKLSYPPQWRQIASIHIDETNIKKHCQQLRRQLEKDQILALLSGDTELALQTEQMEQWDNLLAEHLCWYDPSELDQL